MLAVRAVRAGRATSSPVASLAALLAAGLLLGACGVGGQDDDVGSIELGDDRGVETDAGDEHAPTDPATGNGPDDGGPDDDVASGADDDGPDAGSDADTGGDDADADPGTADDAPVIEEVDTSHLADLTRAEPGIWPVGNAGTVTFDLDGRDLVLRDLDGATGWSVEVEEDERDEIEVAFRRDDVRWRFEVDRSGRDLQIVIEQRIRRADTGGYDLGDAGTFAFDVVDGRLVLTSLEVAEGWEVRDRDEDDEDIELDLRADGRRVEVEVELDGRTVELDISYRVRNRFR